MNCKQFMDKAKNRRVHALSCIMGNTENPNVSIGIHNQVTLPNQAPLVQKVVSTIHWIMQLDCLKGLCHGVEFILFYFANYSPSIAMELKVSKEITCK